ncbi:hypothetical protein BO82DRAFT_152671 [Aspergillus uvarum CBS 121591]|uniref:Uncharacterized protein n=1 Tax=Aspergillus uvarum CBS 121591 TaxID=1448315 RepID=A0A319C3I6_9EURO|nr:hypothetical protein BO82DRAFT_152671 [Aspergillus uvarum CBS 121591]PYH78771.1 hypothetical protein BO82DRAFT_152671 [Aspergillus uvarum CBS 121591]
MSDVAETKPDPTTSAPEAAEKPETTTTEAVAEEAKAAAESAAETVKETATKTTDSVFSMFGGGPKKEKVEAEDDKDEPSGSSKAQKAEEEVSQPKSFFGGCGRNHSVVGLAGYCSDIPRFRPSMAERFWVHIFVLSLPIAIPRGTSLTQL